MVSMPKVLVLAALMSLLSVVIACGSLSVEDYAEECYDWEDDYGYMSFDSGDVSDLEDALDDWNALSPPGEVKALHDIRAEMMKLGIQIAQEGETLEDQLDDLRDDMDDAPRRDWDDIRDEMDDRRDDYEDRVEDLWDQLEDLGDDFEDEMDDLPRSVERDLDDEGCF